MSEKKSTERRWELINKQLLGEKISQEELQELKELNVNLPKSGIRRTRKLAKSLIAEGEYYD